MALNEYVESEVAVAVAATAIVLSPRARRVLRRGAVYGLAGALRAGDAVASFARGAARGAKETASVPTTETADSAAQPTVGAQGAEGGT